jgi:cytochrome c
MLRSFMGCLACAVTLTGQLVADEKQDAVALVEKAIVFAKAKGKDKVLAEISTPGGAFDRGELYVFAYDFSGVVLAHPKNAKLIGKNLLEMPDLDGKLFRKDIVNIAKKQGSGWVDYKYKNPETGKSEDKTTYFKAAEDHIYCCGIYK